MPRKRLRPEYFTSSSVSRERYLFERLSDHREMKPKEAGDHPYREIFSAAADSALTQLESGSYYPVKRVKSRLHYTKFLEGLQGMALALGQRDELELKILNKKPVSAQEVKKLENSQKIVSEFSGGMKGLIVQAFESEETAKEFMNFFWDGVLRIQRAFDTSNARRVPLKPL